MTIADTERTDWYSPDQVPARPGWYERDHRNVAEYENPADRCICLDLWAPVGEGDPLHPGVWYVQEPGYWWRNPITREYVWMDGLNDASHQNLPWRGLRNPA